MTALFVRDEPDADRARVRAVQQAAFGRPDEARLADALRASLAPLVSLVAEEGSRLVGHALLSPVAIEGAPAAPLGLRYGIDALEPAFQVQELVPGALAGRRGLVRYAQAFRGL